MTADMNGDGLADIVRVRNGEVCYWPNLGYGKFGAKVSMRNAPYFNSLDRFDLSFVQFADISGTGAADLIYLGRGGSLHGSILRATPGVTLKLLIHSPAQRFQTAFPLSTFSAMALQASSGRQSCPRIVRRPCATLI